MQRNKELAILEAATKLKQEDVGNVEDAKKEEIIENNNVPEKKDDLLDVSIRFIIILINK